MNRRHNIKDWSPLDWHTIFDHNEEIKIAANEKINVYTAGDPNYSVHLIFIHGGGSSALSWALTIREIKNYLKCQCITYDLRGHGRTQSLDESDLSINLLTNDCLALLVKLAEKHDNNCQFVLIGHSLGGSIATHVVMKCLDMNDKANHECGISYNSFDKQTVNETETLGSDFDKESVESYLLRNREKIPQIIALISIDVVEGTALEALTSMQGYLRSRPSYFNTLEEAIQWSIKNGLLKNVESARISMAGELKQIKLSDLKSFSTPSLHSHGGGNLANKFDKNMNLKLPPISESKNLPQSSNIQIVEDVQIKTDDSVHIPVTNVTPCPKINQGDSLFSPSAKDPDRMVYTWRASLEASEKYWKDWFIGLSSGFINIPPTIPKLLILAGLEHLDKILTIGQMQGKFQFAVIAKSGHFVHQDMPDQVAGIIVAFLIKHQVLKSVNELNDNKNSKDRDGLIIHPESIAEKLKNLQASC